MKKLLIIAAIVVILLGVVAPGGMGMLAEQHYRQMWGEALATEPSLAARVTGFERGWWQSSATVEIDINEAGLAAMLIELGLARSGEQPHSAIIELHERIHHGPFALGAPAPAGQRLKPGPGIVHTRLTGKLADAETITNTTHMGLTGRLHSHVRLEAMELPLEDGSQLIIESPFTLDIRTSRDFERLRTRGQGGTLRILDAQGHSMTLAHPVISADQQRGPANIWLGTLEFSLERLESRLPDTAPSSLQGLNWQVTTETRDGLIEQQQQLHVQSLGFGHLDSGPLRLDMRLSRLDGEALADFHAWLAEWPTPHIDADSGNTDLLVEARDILLALARHEPVMAVEHFSLGVGEGEITGDARIQLIAPSPEQFETHLKQGALLRLFAGEGRLRTTREHARNSLAATMSEGDASAEMEQEINRLADNQIDTVIAEGLLIESNGDLEIRVQLEDGVLHLNEREIYRSRGKH